MWVNTQTETHTNRDTHTNTLTHTQGKTKGGILSSHNWACRSPEKQKIFGVGGATSCGVLADEPHPSRIDAKALCA